MPKISQIDEVPCQAEVRILQKITLKISKSKKSEQYFRDEIEIFIRLFDEHFARHFESHWGETWHYTGRRTVPQISNKKQFKQKMNKMCLLLLCKSERRKNNCYLVFDDKNIKNEVFFFSKRINSKHGWLLHRKPLFHSRNPKIKGDLQSNRVYCWL